MPTYADFVDVPLRDVVSFFKDLHDIEIQIDSSETDTDVPVTFNMKGVTLRSALARILDPQGLIAIVEDECILITGPQAARSKVSIRGYSLSCIAPADRPGLLEVLQMANEGRDAKATGAAGEGGMGGGPPPTLAPFEIKTFGGMLVVRGTTAEHAAVKDLLWMLSDGGEFNRTGAMPAAPVPAEKPAE